MELQENQEAFAERGLAIAAISYDSADILQSFATRYEITFPLLSDVGSKVIRRFGILNTSIPEDRPNYGIPYPGQYIVDPQGVVVSKYFEEAYSERVTSGSMLVRDFDWKPESRGLVENDHLTIEYFASDATVHPQSQTTLVLDIRLKPKMHVYAPGVAEDFIPISWTLPEAETYVGKNVEFPEAEVLDLPAIGAAAPVYHGRFRLLLPVALAKQGPLTEALGDLRTEPRELVIATTFRYQACDENVCYFPIEVPLTFRLQVQPNTPK